MNNDFFATLGVWFVIALGVLATVLVAVAGVLTVYASVILNNSWFVDFAVGLTGFLVLWRLVVSVGKGLYSWGKEMGARR